MFSEALRILWEKRTLERRKTKDLSTVLNRSKNPEACRVTARIADGRLETDTAEFGGLLGYAPIMPVNEFGCDAFINRKGRIPAPIHSFKN